MLSPSYNSIPALASATLTDATGVPLSLAAQRFAAEMAANAAPLSAEVAERHPLGSPLWHSDRHESLAEVIAARYGVGADPGGLVASVHPFPFDLHRPKGDSIPVLLFEDPTKMQASLEKLIREHAYEADRLLPAFLEKKKDYGGNGPRLEHSLREAMKSLRGGMLTPSQGVSVPGSIQSQIKDKYKSQWTAVKSALVAKHPQEMRQFLYFRKTFVDTEIDLLRKKYPGLLAKSVGSSDLTSDYDITLATPGTGDDVLAVRDFNQRVQAIFGKAPGTVFDTNLYAKDFLKVEENINPGSRPPKADGDLEQPAGAFDQLGGSLQDVAALLKQRRYMDEGEWRAYTQKVLRQYEKDYLEAGRKKYGTGAVPPAYLRRLRDEQTRVEEQYLAAETIFQKSSKQFEESFKQAKAQPGAGEDEDDLKLRVSNDLYVKHMTDVRKHQKDIRIWQGDGALSASALGANRIDPNVERAAVKDSLGQALFFASEAYHSEGAVQHIVAGLQGNNAAEALRNLSANDLLQSVNEQLGDFLKDVSHYEGKPHGLTFYRSSKYLHRLFDAVYHLKTPRKGVAALPDLPFEKRVPAKGEFLDGLSDLKKIRSGDSPYNESAWTEDAKRKKAEDVIAHLFKAKTASDLKMKILEISSEINSAVRLNLSAVGGTAGSQKSAHQELQSRQKHRLLSQALLPEVAKGVRLRSTNAPPMGLIHPGSGPGAGPASKGIMLPQHSGLLPPKSANHSAPSQVALHAKKFESLTAPRMGGMGTLTSLGSHSAAGPRKAESHPAPKRHGLLTPPSSGASHSALSGQVAQKVKKFESHGSPSLGTSKLQPLTGQRKGSRLQATLGHGLPAPRSTSNAPSGQPLSSQSLHSSVSGGTNAGPSHLERPKLLRPVVVHNRHASPVSPNLSAPKPSVSTAGRPATSSHSLGNHSLSNHSPSLSQAASGRTTGLPKITNGQSTVFPSIGHPTIGRLPKPAGDAHVQFSGHGAHPDVNPAALRSDLRKQSGGITPDSNLRAKLGGHLGFDPGGARLHTGPAAAQASRALNAEAFTIGNDVFFGDGRFDPHSPKGMGLIAHELTHVGQQTGTTGSKARFFTERGGDEMEREAQQTGERVLANAGRRSGLFVEDYVREYQSEGGLTHSDQQRLDRISLEALNLAEWRLAIKGLHKGSIGADALDVQVELDLGEMSDADAARVWADAIVSALQAQRNAAANGLPAVAVQRAHNDEGVGFGSPGQYARVAGHGLQDLTKNMGPLLQPVRHLHLPGNMEITGFVVGVRGGHDSKLGVGGGTGIDGVEYLDLTTNKWSKEVVVSPEIGAGLDAGGSGGVVMGFRVSPRGKYGPIGDAYKGETFSAAAKMLLGFGIGVSPAVLSGQEGFISFALTAGVEAGVSGSYSYGSGNATDLAGMWPAVAGRVTQVIGFLGVAFQDQAKARDKYNNWGNVQYDPTKVGRVARPGVGRSALPGTPADTGAHEQAARAVQQTVAASAMHQEETAHAVMQTPFGLAVQRQGSDHDEPLPKVVLEWIGGTLAGGYNSDPSTSQIVTDLGLSLIPGVGEVTAGRDITADLYFMVGKGQYEAWTRWLSLVFNTIGLVPELGGVVKDVGRLALKGGVQAVEHGIEMILPRIAEHVSPVRLLHELERLQGAVSAHWGSLSGHALARIESTLAELKSALHYLPGVGVVGTLKRNLARVEELAPKKLAVAFTRVRNLINEGLGAARKKLQALEARVEGESAKPHAPLMPHPAPHPEPHAPHEPHHEPGKKPHDPKQKSANLDELYREAAVAQQELDRVTRHVAGEIGAEPLIPLALKGRERALAKINADYGKDASRIVDLARSSIVCDTPEQVQRAYELLQKESKVIRVKDRFAAPKGGYRDMLLNLEMANGHVVEVQIHLRKILEVKNSAVGHGIYEEIQKIERTAATENRAFTRQEAEKLEELNRKMKGEYDAAYHASERAHPPKSVHQEAGPRNEREVSPGEQDLPLKDKTPKSPQVWPPQPPRAPKPPVGEAGADVWRYERYRYIQYQKGAKPGDILPFVEWKPRYFDVVKSGGRSGRIGGAQQVAAKTKLARLEGYHQVENVKLGKRFPDMFKLNTHGGKDYVEVGKMLKKGIPESRERVKLAEEVLSLGKNDTITFVDKVDTSRRITYRPGDSVGTKTTK